MGIMVWAELNRRVRRTGAIPTTLNQLRAKIIFEWNNLPQNYVQRYVTSIGRRGLAVNSAGGQTRYYVDMDAAAGFVLRIL